MDHANTATIGILYPGDMGSSVGKLLCDSGFRVVTSVEGRSLRTHQHCRTAGLNVLPSIREVVECSDIVISLVTPAAALQVATDVAALAKDSRRRFLYVNANSISPMTVGKIAEVLQLSPIDFVDAAIHGVASQLGQRGILYLSGPRANEIAVQFGPVMRVKVVGDAPGQASTLKMILSGISKGLVGLFVEALVLARDMHLLADALEGCEYFYPGVTEAVKRMLPTYPQHAPRRSEELQEVEHTMLMNGLTPHAVRGAREVIADMASLKWEKGRDAQQWTISEILKEVHRNAARHVPGSCRECYFRNLHPEGHNRTITIPPAAAEAAKVSCEPDAPAGSPVKVNIHHVVGNH